MRHSFAYLFERFPSFVQLFTLREVEEMGRQGARPLVFSIRDRDERPGDRLDPGLPVRFLPDKDSLRTEVRGMAAQKRLPKALLPAIQQWGDGPDKFRLYEAAWLGPRLRAAGIRHVHAHFAGIAARTCFWLKRYFGIRYSFTGHANDIFRESDGPVTLSDLIREAAFVATVSDFSRRQLQERFGGLKRAVFTVYNGIKKEDFVQARPAAAAPEILSVGRLVEKKGFPQLIRACGELAARGAGFTCRIVGEGPMREDLERQIAVMGLNGRVILEGAKNEAEIRRMLAESRVFALACVEEADGGMDNLPTVITEAMAAALPVVSTRIAGVPEQVVDGGTGFLCEPGDAAAFAGALEKLLADPGLAERLGLAGRERAGIMFGIDRTVRALKHLLLRHGRARLTAGILGKDPAAALAFLRRNRLAG